MTYVLFVFWFFLVILDIFFYCCHFISTCIGYQLNLVSMYTKFVGRIIFLCQHWGFLWGEIYPSRRVCLEGVGGGLFLYLFVNMHFLKLYYTQINKYFAYCLSLYIFLISVCDSNLIFCITFRLKNILNILLH